MGQNMLMWYCTIPYGFGTKNTKVSNFIQQNISQLCGIGWVESMWKNLWMSLSWQSNSEKEKKARRGEKRYGFRYGKKITNTKFDNLKPKRGGRGQGAVSNVLIVNSGLNKRVIIETKKQRYFLLIWFEKFDDYIM